jgi:hypothetical protein
MSGIYEIWKTYAMFIVETWCACCKHTEGLPNVMAMGVLSLPVIAISWFLPLWAALSIYAAIGLPMLWFFDGMFRVFFAFDLSRQHR